jgi:uncharacterized protein (DUF885 family)
MALGRVVLGLILVAGSTGAAVPAVAGDAEQNEASLALHALFNEDWEYRLRDNPVMASYLGDRRYNHRWQDQSLAAFERRHAYDKEMLRKLDGIDFDALPAADRINYRLFRQEYEMAVEGHPYRSYLLSINQRGGVQTANEVADYLPFTQVKDYENWLARMRAFPALMDQNIALLREGVRTGIVHARVIMDRIPAQVESQIVNDPAQSLFFKPFRQFHESIPAEEQARLVVEAKQVIAESIIPSFQKFRTFFTQEYLPACTERVGVWQLPQGKEFYAYRARRFTTTDLTPGEIHQLGHREVKRIRADMEAIIKQVGFQGTFQEFLQFLRTDSQFYYDDPQELLEAYRALSKRLDPELVKIFKTLPRAPYGVEPIPDHVAPDTTTAYYREPAADGSRAGTYFVNLYKPETRPKYEMEALSIHEAVPGHHLQIALMMELGELPAFRRYGGYTAFVEGWGLYSESLGTEMGFYQDPYSKFGQLTYEMWRAVRLVVDTGMHSMGWTRQQAIDFFKANAAKTELDIVNEIDRYIAWPGQALAYKIGELKIKELRARATEALGERFDIREFHDVVLLSGAVPLDVLEDNVDAWIAGLKAEGSAGAP